MTNDDARIRVVGEDGLTPVMPTPGLERLQAFDTERAVVLQARAEGGAASGWHHHGDRDVYGYLISGRARMEFGTDGNDSVELEAGEFMHVPAGLVHRDINPDPSQG